MIPALLLVPVVLIPSTASQSAPVDYVGVQVELKKCKEEFELLKYKNDRETFLAAKSFDELYSYFLFESKIAYAKPIRQAVKKITFMAGFKPLEFAGARRFVARYLYESMHQSDVSVDKMLDEALIADRSFGPRKDQEKPPRKDP